MANQMARPPPPGEEFKALANPKDANRQDFFFYIRAFDDRGKDKPADQKDKPSEEFPVLITVRQPTDYVKPETIKYVNVGNANELSVPMKAQADFGGADPCPVDVVFPIQRNINPAAMREGAFRRTVPAANQSIRLYAKNMPVRGEATDLGIFHIAVDGVPRAYVFKHAFMANTEAKGAEVTTLAGNAIRLYEH